jgi:enoyl-CoA hydratase/carnithine racemase
MNYAHVLLRIDNGVAWAVMNRPERLNALNPGLIADLNNLFGELCERPDIRVVVLTGAGNTFCAGLDLKDESARAARLTVSQGLAAQRRLRNIVPAMRRCPQPIIALLNGAASGGGFALALAADIRIAVPQARMNAAFIRIGASACDMGVSYFLPRMVGTSVASHYMLTGRFIDAQQALSLGLVSEICSPAEINSRAQLLCADMLRATPLGLRLTKEALGHAADMPGLEAAIAMEDRNQILCLQGEDFDEGVAAFLEKRTPRYTGQ